MPLPRWVLSRAPASTARVSVSGSAAVCARATTTPLSVAPADELEGAGPLGSQGHDPDAAPGGVLPGLELVPVGVADGGQRVGASVAVDVRDVRPFQVDADDPGGDVGETLAGLGDRPDAVVVASREAVIRVGQSRAVPRPALAADDRGDLVDRQGRVRERDAPAAVVWMSQKAGATQSSSSWRSSRSVGRFDGRDRRPSDRLRRTQFPVS